MDKYFTPNNMTTEMLFNDGIVADNEKVWLVISKHSILIEIDRKTGVMSPCGFIANERNKNINKSYTMSYRYLFIHGKNLYIIPYCAKDICVYNIEEKTFKYIELDVTKLDGNDAWEFTGYEKIDEKVIVYGLHPLILIIDLTTFQIEYLNLKDKLPENLDIKHWFLRYSYSQNKNLILVPLDCPCVIEINILNKQVKYYKLPESNIVWIDNPVLDNSVLYYFERRKGETVELIKYDLKLENTEAYSLGIKRQDDRKVFSYIAYFNEALWMLPGSCGVGYKFDINKGKMEKIDDLPIIHTNKLSNNFPYEFNYRNGWITADGHLITIHAWSHQLIDINMVNGNVETTPIIKKKTEKWIELFNEILNIFSDDNIKREWDASALELYLAGINFKDIKENNELADKAGNRIYQAMYEN